MEKYIYVINKKKYINYYSFLEASLLIGYLINSRLRFLINFE